MPCYLTGSREGDMDLEMKELRARAQTVNAMLCEVCEVAEEHEFLDLLPVQVRAWWAQHKLQDERERNRKVESRQQRITQLREELAELEGDCV